MIWGYHHFRKPPYSHVNHPAVVFLRFPPKGSAWHHSFPPFDLETLAVPLAEQTSLSWWWQLKYFLEVSPQFFWETWSNFDLRIFFLNGLVEKPPTRLKFERLFSYSPNSPLFKIRPNWLADTTLRCNNQFCWSSYGFLKGSDAGHLHKSHLTKSRTGWMVVLIFFKCSPLLGEMIQFDSYFTNGLVQKPTRKSRNNWN